MSDADFDREQVAAAERLDGEITEVLAGRSGVHADPVTLWLATSLRATPPPGVRSRDARAIAGRGMAAGGWNLRFVRLVAAALALAFAWNGMGNLFLSGWVAAQLGEPHALHPYVEAGWAMVAAAIAVGAGALRRRWLPVSVGAGVPLGVLLGSQSLHEFDVFPAGAALHAVEGMLAIVLLVTWWVSRRYDPDRGGEEPT